MIRLLVSAAVYLAANAVGLIVAAIVLDDMSLDTSGFLLALVIFTGVEVVTQPLMTKIAMQHARPLLGGTALVTTLVGLVITAWLSDGLRISGAVTWLLATVIVWVAALLAGLLLPVLLVKLGVSSAARRQVTPG